MIFDTLVFWSNSNDSKNLKIEGAVEEIYGYTTEEFQEIETLWYDVIHPDDKRYLDFTTKNMDRYNSKEASVKYRIIRKDGTVKNVLGTIKKSGKSHYSGYLMDLSGHHERHMFEVSNEKILLLLQEAIYLLYQIGDNRHHQVRTVFERLSDLLQIDNIYFYSVENSKGTEELLKLSEVWRRKDENLPNDAPIISQYLNVKKTLPIFYKHLVEERNPFNEIVSLLPTKERGFFEKLNVQSTIAIPIWLEDEFRGFIRFDDCKHERYLSADSLRVLKTFGSIITTSFEYEKIKKSNLNEIEQLKELREERDNYLKMFFHEFKTPLSIVELNLSMLKNYSDYLPKHNTESFGNKISRVNRSVETMKELIDAILASESDNK